MFIQLKQKVTFQKKVFGPGEVDLDVSKLSPVEVKYLHKLIKAGLALEANQKPVEVISEHDRQQRLSEKLLKEVPEPRGPIKDPGSLPDGVKPSEKKAEESGEGESSDESTADESDGEESSAEAEESEEGGDEADSSGAASKKSKKKKRRG